MTEPSTAEARDLLEAMVSTPSVSGNEDACARRLIDFFETHDREAWRDEVGNVRAPAEDAVLLTSHIDTVPGEIPVRIEDGVLWGRGSVDATGPLVAMATTAVRTGVSFAGVVREETDSAGARHLVEDRTAPEAVINGEPSGWDGITLGYRGMLAGTYAVATESAHTSRPEPNAIQQAIQWWHSVEEAFAASEGSDPVFETVTAKPVEVTGGTSEDGLAVESSMDVQFRIPPGETPESVRKRVEGRLETGSVAWRDPIEPVMASPRNPVAAALRRGIRAADGEPTHLRKTGTSDMNIFAGAWDVPMATYGPGDSDLDHTPEERLDLGEFDRSVAVLESAAATLR